MTSILDRLKTMGIGGPAFPEQTVTVQRPSGAASVPKVLLSSPSLDRGVSGAAVGESHDLSRICELPRRVLNLKDEQIAQRWTWLLGRPRTEPCACQAVWGFCIEKFLPIQGLSLEEASKMDGLLGLCGVGSGKTGMDIMLPMVVPGCKVALLLLPPNLKAQFLHRDFPQWSVHFKTPNLAGAKSFTTGLPVLHVVSYSELSSARSTDLIKRIRPDLIIGDEAHNVSRRDAARTKRFLRHFTEYEGVRFVALSGTLTQRSLQDYAHLSALALGEGSPLPTHWPTVEEWAGAIDAETATKMARPRGALRRLCKDDNEHVREAFRRRLVETPGVVATEEGVLGTSLYLQERVLDVPAEIADALAGVRQTWQRPDGEELTDGLSKSKVCRELAAGFYYRWRWPRNEPLEVRERWLHARKEWHKELREKLKRAREQMDSPLLLMRAAARWFDGFTAKDEETGETKVYPPHTRHRLTWASETYEEWIRVKDTAEPATEAVWLSDYLVEDAGKWAKENVGLVWYSHSAFGLKLARMFNLPLFGPGDEANAEILKERGDRTIVVSAKAHGTGKNLQMFSKNLVCNPGSSGKDWEQCLDASTEVLTESGWKGIDDVWDSRCAQYDIETGGIEWVTGDRIERFLNPGEKMYGIQNPHLDLRVTAGHRMVVRGNKRYGSGGLLGQTWRPRAFLEAGKLTGRYRLPLAGRWEAPGVPLTPAELMFIGLFMTDGNLSTGNKAISLFQSDRYPSIQQLIRDVLKNCGMRFHESRITTPSNFGPRKHALSRWAIAYGPPKNKEERLVLRGWGHLAPFISKELSPALMGVTREQLECLLTGMWAGDGSKTAGTYAEDRFNSRTWSICSKRREVLDKLQALCVTRGYRANVSKRAGESVGMIHVSPKDEWTVNAFKIGDGRPSWGEMGTVPSERVWCARVPLGAIIVRRNGKAAVVGNCLGRTHRTGQRSDEVWATIYRHTTELKEALEQATEDARYVEQTTGQKQKLLYANRDW